jgi:hypothetical protein
MRIGLTARPATFNLAAGSGKPNAIRVYLLPISLMPEDRLR